MRRLQSLHCTLHTFVGVLLTILNTSAWITFCAIVLLTYCLSNIEIHLHTCTPNTYLLTIPFSANFMCLCIGWFRYACIHLLKLVCGSVRPLFLSINHTPSFPNYVRIILLHSRQSSKLPLCIRHHLAGIACNTQSKAWKRCFFGNPFQIYSRRCLPHLGHHK